MKVLIVCESSGTVREAFRALGHDAWSCDLLPADDGSPFHIQGDALEAIRGGQPDLVGMHPPCTFINGAGLHWITRGRIEADGRPRIEHHREAMAFVRAMMEFRMPWYLENPVGAIGTQIRPADQSIQPYEFGDDASKRTCLWINKLPILIKDPSQRIAGRIVKDPKTGKTVERWANQTDGGQNKLPPSDLRWKLRSKTYPGIARAMAQQWGGIQIPTGQLQLL